MAYDLHLMTLLNGACPYVEVMNEPDIEGVNSAAYLAFWNAFVPQARALYPHVAYGGPADYDNQGNECTYSPDGTSACFLQKVMTGMAASGVLPDFVTYHWYPCWNNTASQCMALASGFAQAAQQVIGWTQATFPGKSIPVICSEWNADPGNPTFMDNQTWAAQFLTAALESMQTSGLAGAMYYDVAGVANWGTDDLFDVYTNDGQARQQFTALGADIAAAQGGTPPPPPTPSPSPSPTPPGPTPTPIPPTPTPIPPTPSPSPTPPPPSGQTFSDGFESGNTDAWTETYLAGLNTLAVESSNAHSGKYALGMVKGINQGDVDIQENLAANSGKGLASAQTGWAMKLATPKGRGMMQLAQWDTGAGGQYFLAGLWLTYNTSTGYTDLELLDGNYQWHECALPSPLYGAWHVYSLTYTGANAKIGGFSLSIDGKVACAASGIRTARTGTPNLTAVQFGSIGSDASTGMAIWLDDVSIAPAA